MKFFLKRQIFRIRFLFYFISGQYGSLIGFCRKLSPYSKRLDGKIFADDFFENYVLRSAEKILNNNSINYKDWSESCSLKNPKIALLATTIADSGGHTECILRFVDAFEKEFKIVLFLNNCYGDSQKTARLKFKYLNHKIEVKSHKFTDYEESIVDNVSSIIEYNPDIVFVYAHMLDAVSVAVIGIIRKYGRAKIIFNNHGDHLLSLGKSFADLIIEARKVGQYLTQRYGGYKNTCILPFQVNGRSRPTLSREQIDSERDKLKIGRDEVISLSGFSSNKVFRDKNLEYFLLLKRLFISEPNFRHILISNLSSSELNRIKEIFSDHPHLIDRIIFSDLVPDFEKYVQISDFFIDSFPLGSALAHVDVIKYKKPTVIKVNTENQLNSFEYYLYDDYELSCKSLDDMHNKSLELIRNKCYRMRIGEKVYSHYVDTYDNNKSIKVLRDIILNSNRLNVFFQPLDDDVKFNIGISG